MLPGPESDYVRGKKLVLIPLKSGLAGLAICKDMDFISPASRYSQEAVGVMFVPALDFVIDDRLHAKPAFLRGVEGGYSVVRSAQWGLLSVTDAYGRVVVLQKTSSKNPTFLVVQVPMGSGNSIYSRYGNWFVWLCGILFLIFLCVLFSRGK
jgi:apolipoprotein N-acyltransferase